MSFERIEKSFSCSDSPHLTLSNIRGSVKIQPGEQSVIAVTAAKDNGSGDCENTLVEISQTRSGGVIVHTHYELIGCRSFRKWQPCKVDYEVFVPKVCSLEINGVSNSTSIEGLSGELHISTVSGNVECRSLMGQIALKTVSGNVEGEVLTGPAELKTVSGKISFQNCDLPVLKCNTISGDLVIETRLGSGPYDIKSVSGDFYLNISPLAGATVTSLSLSGKLRTSLPMQSINNSGGLRTYEFGGGGIEIRHNSVSGDIILSTENDQDSSEIRVDEIELGVGVRT